MASAADPLLVLYGSETGNARDVAERIAREAARGGDDAGPVHCLSMDRFEVTQLPTAPLVVCVCSTTGQGDPPANMRDFWRFLLRKSLPADSLNAVRFAVFGLGDSHYQKYNVAAKRLHRRLLALGARELLDLGLGDDQHPTGYEATLDPWLERLWRALGRTVGPATSAHHQSESRACADPCRVVVRVVEAPEGVGLNPNPNPNPNPNDDRPVCDVEARVRELCDAARELDRALEAAAAIPPRLLRSSSETASSSSSSARAFTERRPAVATVLVNAPLTAPDADAEVRHVEIAAADILGDGEPPHRPGDCLAVSPLPLDDDDDRAGETRAATIEVLRRAGIAPDAWVVCEGGQGLTFTSGRRSGRRRWWRAPSTLTRRPRDGTSSKPRLHSRRIRERRSVCAVSRPKTGATSCGTTTSASVGACASFSTIFHPCACRSGGC